MQVAGGFSIMMQTSIILGIIVALPVIIYQVWAFLSPALHKHEKKLAIPVIVGAVALFVGGAALAWFFVLPMTLKFLTGMGEDNFDQVISATDYFSFVSTLVLLMGAVFELPILILILSVIGLVTPQFLAKFRKHAIIGSYLVAAIITPGDAFTATVGLVVPIYLLYEVSIGVSWVVQRMKQRKKLADEAAEAAA
jgi:sec-independent protein translocase protein TatC